eukprot:TRINITY_DN6286_c0_g1_i1.p1 TRINITY_DN6286_c0_g1~~TRINITY_DN6286_c0_g1_i1.p1  ORF type:complete len:859 (+),score=168.64 TRINITY_DN6286_c0_g1_i1:38-2578(+)
MDIDTILKNAVSPDQTLRKEAEKSLLQAEAANFPAFLLTLASELGREERDPGSRKLAGIILKNSFDHKDQNKILRWRSTDINAKQQLKAIIYHVLVSNVREARHQASQVISKIALIEIPLGEWLDLIPNLVQGTQNPNAPPTFIESTLETLGFICEEIEPNFLKDQSNYILTAVVNGMAKEGNKEIKIAAANALINALEFARSNFENETERNIIVQVVGQSTSSDDPKLRELAFQCLVKIAGLYYDKLVPYIAALYQVTLKAIKEESGAVALQAIEFWSTVCEEEIDILEEDNDEEGARRCYKLVQGALDGLVPVLTETLTKQEEDQDEDTWNESMAASTCLSYVANTVGDNILPKAFEFIKPNLDNPNWHYKEAAIIALGSVMEGCKVQELKNYLNSILPNLFVYVKDPNSVHVRDTTAWVLGRICQFHSDVMSINLQSFVQVLGSSLQDVPRVAGNCAYALYEIAKFFEPESDPPQSSPLSVFFQAAVQTLLSVTERPDATENNLRSSAYEAVNAFIQSAPNDCLPFMGQLIQFFLERLHKTFTTQTVSQDEKEELNEQRAMICGSLYHIIQRLGSEIKPFADAIMSGYLQVLSVKCTSVHEETLIGIGALANAMETEFEKYLSSFLPFLLFGLRNWQEYEICSISVGVVGDVARAVHNKMIPYTDEIINALLEDLKNPELNRNVKPPILSAFGDIALALGGAFEKYHEIVVTVLHAASATPLTDKNDEDLIDYLNALRESIFDAYTGILQGLKADEKAVLMLEFAKPIVDFAEIALRDDFSSDSVVRAAIGVIGDLAHCLQGRVNHLVMKDSLRQIISKHAKNASDNQNTRQVANWALSLLRG